MLIRTIISFLLVITYACNSNNVNQVIISSNFNPKNILINKNNLQNILTKDMIANTLDISVEEIEESIENKLSSDGQHTVLYSWPTGKSTKVGDGKFEINEYHSVSIGFVNKMNESGFLTYYGTNEGLQMQVNQLVEDKKFDKEVGIVEAQDMVAYAKQRKVEKLENIGTAACWESSRHCLHVLAKGVSFTITANFGDNEDLAKKVQYPLLMQF